MTCGCNDKCELPKALQINNPGEVTLFHRVDIPASQGDDETYPPKNGLHRNVLLVYLANNHSYLYNSDGIPTRVDGPAGPGTAAGGETGQVLTKRSDDDYDTIWTTPAAVNDATLTISENETPVGTFTANSDTDTTIDITVPTKTSDLENDGATGDSTYVEATALADYYTKSESDSTFQGKLTAGSNITINANNEISATDTTYSDFTGATSSADGTHGLVPAPTTSDPDKFLKGDGTWGTPPGATYTGGTGIDITDNVVSVDNTIATVTDLGEKVDIASIDLTGQTTTLLALTKALGTNNIDYARWECRTDIGSANISDKPTGYNASFVCEAYCNRWTASNDYRYQLICWVKENTNPFVAYIANHSSSITWERLRPTVNDATLTIQKNGTTVETFTANSSSNKTANITVPTKTSDLTNDGADGTSTYVEADELAPGYITGEGTDITLSNTQGGRFSDVKLKGDTTQGIALPNGYQQVEYIASAGGSSGAYIDSGVKASNTIKVVTTAALTSGFLFGEGLQGNWVDFGIQDENGYYRGRIRKDASSNSEVTSTVALGDTFHTIEMSQGDGLWIDGSKIGTFTSFAFTATNTMYIHAWQNGSGANLRAVAKIKDFKIYDNNTLVKWFVPCKRISDGVAGYYEMVGGEFKPSASGTAFTAGGPTPTPSTPQTVQTVTGEQTIAITGKNLCNGISQGYWLNAAANNAGVTSNDSGLIIPVAQNTDYTISTTATQARYRIAFSDQVWGGSQFTCYNGQNSDNTSASITKNSGTHKYLVVNATDLTKIQVEKGSAATTYESYHGQSYEINLSKNLIDLSMIFVTYGVNTSTGAIASQAERAAVYKVPIKPSTSYIVSCASGYKIGGGTNYYGSNGAFLRNTGSGWGDTKSFTSDADAYYVSFVVRNDAGTSLSGTDPAAFKLQMEEGSTVTEYTPHVELCKIGTAQDYIYKKDDGNWYLHKAVGKLADAGTSGWNTSGAVVATGVKAFLLSGAGAGIAEYAPGFCNLATVRTSWSDWTTGDGLQSGNAAITSNNLYFKISETLASTVAQLKSFLALTPIVVYYHLTTPTETQITGSLLDELNALDNATTYNGYTYIHVGSVSPDLPVILDVTAEEKSDLPAATKTNVGAVAVGDGLEVTDGGVLSLADNVVYSEDPGTPIGDIVDPYTYSTSETRIGTWIDGKPIYRKVFHITNPAKTNTNYAIVSSSLDACVALYGYMKINDGTAIPVPQTDSSSTYSVLLVNASGYLRGRFSYADGLPVSVYVTVEYTKTTD